MNYYFNVKGKCVLVREKNMGTSPRATQSPVYSNNRIKTRVTKFTSGKIHGSR